MVRLNLQLFAKATVTKTVSAGASKKKNVNDIAKEVIAGKWGNGSARKTALQNAGYNYSEVQSAVNSMIGSSGSKSSSSKPSNSTKTSSSTPKTSSGSSKISSISGVDQALTDKINSSYAESGKVTNAKNEANKYLEKVQQLGSVTDIISQDTWDKINTPFQESQAYQDAMAYTNTLLQQLSSGRTSYTDQIKDLMGQIQNRDKFEYDVDTDTLFQQSLASAMGSGKIAMQDTMGQATALTGGYGSTYAQNVGNQAYNSYIEDAYNNLPEYYQMALESYQMEGQEMYNQLAMLNDADASEYQRMYDSWNANFTSSQQMYAQEYGAWQDGINNAMNSANLQLSEYGQLYDQAYNTYTATQGYADTLYAQEYQKWADEVANAMNYANMQNADYWNNKNFIEQQNQFKQDMNYKYAALKQDNDQFLASLSAKSSGGGSSSSGGGSKTPSGSGTKEPSETQLKRALEAYNNGGDNALNQYVDSLGSDVDMGIIANYIDSYGSYTEPLTYTVIDDGGINWFGGVDNNVMVEDQNGNKYKLSDLKKTNKDLAKELSKLKKGQSYTAK